MINDDGGTQLGCRRRWLLGVLSRQLEPKAIRRLRALLLEDGPLGSEDPSGTARILQRMDYC